jgi:hypothetical protein
MNGKYRWAKPTLLLHYLSLRLKSARKTIFAEIYGTFGVRSAMYGKFSGGKAVY